MSRSWRTASSRFLASLLLRSLLALATSSRPGSLEGPPLPSPLAPPLPLACLALAGFAAAARFLARLQGGVALGSAFSRLGG